jgi:hypothetical protein
MVVCELKFVTVNMHSSTQASRSRHRGGECQIVYSSSRLLKKINIHESNPDLEAPKNLVLLSNKITRYTRIKSGYWG